jgi:hypothetical protein
MPSKPSEAPQSYPHIPRSSSRPRRSPMACLRSPQSPVASHSPLCSPHCPPWPLCNMGGVEQILCFSIHIFFSFAFLCLTAKCLLSHRVLRAHSFNGKPNFVKFWSGNRSPFPFIKLSWFRTCFWIALEISLSANLKSICILVPKCISRILHTTR